MTQAMTHGERVKRLILATGLEIWRSQPERVTARHIGECVDMSHSAVLYHYGTADALKSAIAAEAVRIGDTVIVPMLIAAKHPAVSDMPGVDRARYLAGC